MDIKWEIGKLKALEAVFFNLYNINQTKSLEIIAICDNIYM